MTRLSLLILDNKLDSSITYQSVWALQKELQRKRISQEISDTLILCQHEPVITIGRSGKENNLLASPTHLAAKGVSFYEIERGGDITYHGPGQIVGYPILDLNQHRRDVGWYMRTLEEVIIRFLAHFSVISTRREGRTGVWTGNGQGDNFPSRKIASVGVRISRWCTMHGFSVNVLDCHEGFALINPCGFTDIDVTSIEEELKRIGLALPYPKEMIVSEMFSSITRQFVELFNYKDVCLEKSVCSAPHPKSSLESK